jgi:DNA invertase Pin-like site-specific DNA recombinase
MTRDERKVVRRCAVYTRVSTDSGLEQDFNSLDNQREASEAYIKSQAHEGWKLARERYDDGASRAVRWTGRRSRSCWTMLRPAGSR